MLISDTVGFIRELPPDLIAAFRATLEEVQEAALIVHVTDISNPLHADQDSEVEKILQTLGVADRRRLHVFNKSDALPAGDLAALRESNFHFSGSGEHYRENVFVSARTGEGLDELIARIDATMPVDPIVERELALPMSNGRELAMIYACGRVLNSEVSDGRIHLQAQIPESLARRLESFGADSKG